MQKLLESNKEPPNVFVEDKAGNYIPVEELLTPFDKIFHIGNHPTFVDASNAAKLYGTDDPELLSAIFGQIAGLRRGNVKLPQWDFRYIVSFVRSNRPATPNQLCIAVHMALVHLEIFEAFKRMEESFTNTEYDVASRTHTRLTRLFLQLTIALETLTSRKAVVTVTFTEDDQVEPQVDETTDTTPLRVVK